MWHTERYVHNAPYLMATEAEAHLSVAFLSHIKEMIMAKSKSMTGKDGERKLASDHGRGKANSGGEPQKKTTQAGASGKTGSSKQRKG